MREKVELYLDALPPGAHYVVTIERDPEPPVPRECWVKWIDLVGLRSFCSNTPPVDLCAEGYTHLREVIPAAAQGELPSRRRWRVVMEDYGRSIRMANSLDSGSEIYVVEVAGK